MATNGVQIFMRNASLGVLCLATAPGVALAQNAAESQAAPEASTADIVVTAQFRAQNLQDTPIAITAMNADMMEARSQTGLADVAQSAPNVTIRQSVSAYGNTAALSIRGVGQFDNNFAYEPGVGLYVDDVYYPTVYGAQLDLLDLDRVEILRGPQGTLAGKNSIGGAVKLYSRRPRGTGEGFIEATVGNFDRLDFRASVDVPIIEDRVALRLAGVYKSREGHVRRMDYGCLHPGSGVPRQAQSGSSCKLGSLGGQDFQGLRGSLSIRPSERLEVLLIADWTRDNSQVAGTRISAVNNTALGPFAAGVDMSQFLEGGRYVNYGTFADSARNLVVSDRNGYKGWGVSGQIDYEFSDDLKLTSITAYRKYSANYGLDLDGSPYAFATQSFGLGFRSFSQEVRLTGAAFDEMLNYTVGGFYFKAKGRYDSVIDFLSPPNNFYAGRDRIPSDSKSGFAHVEVHPFDKFTLSGGLRYTDESKDFTFGRVSYLPGAFPLGALNGQTFKYSASRWDYRLSADYRWSGNLMTYATFSTGFKGGGINPRPFFVEQVVPFFPETLKAFEVGAKLDFLDRRVRLNLSAFLNKYNDIQLILNQRFLGTAPASVPINAGRAEMKGFEAELNIKPVDGLLIDASLSHLDFDYKSLTAEAVASGIRFDMIAPFTSDWKLSGGMQYEIDAGSIGSFTPRFDYAYQTKFWSNASNRATNRTSGYGIANARLTWRHPDQKFEVAASVTNMFDKYYSTVNYDNLYSIAGVAQATLGRPREWALTAKYNF